VIGRAVERDSPGMVGESISLRGDAPFRRIRQRLELAEEPSFWGGRRGTGLGRKTQKTPV